MSALRIIGVEEHIWPPALRDRLMALPYEIGGPLGGPGAIAEQLLELGEGRLPDMDAMGVDVQVLSVTTPATQVLDPADAVACAREANDVLGRVVADNPERYQAFATLPTPDPARAADELERCVSELGLRGAMVAGRTGDRFLDHPDFLPILQRAAALGVPLHLHPQRRWRRSVTPITPRGWRTTWRCRSPRSPGAGTWRPRSTPSASSSRLPSSAPRNCRSSSGTGAR